MGKKLSETEVACYERDGPLFPGDVFMPAELDTRATVFMPVRAGQMFLHHTHLVHPSGANRSDDRRIGLRISYIPTHVRWVCKTRLSAMLVRGVDRYGNFDDEIRPRADFGAAERNFHTGAITRFRAANREKALHYEAVGR
jgi:non-heme Fe2+,alpha-ketoglutarate-dependent halogenase